MIEIDHRVIINLHGVKYSIGFAVDMEDNVIDHGIISRALEIQMRAIKHAIAKVLLGDDCEHHPSEKIIGITSLEPICNQCIRERIE